MFHIPTQNPPLSLLPSVPRDFLGFRAVLESLGMSKTCECSTGGPGLTVSTEKVRPRGFGGFSSPIPVVWGRGGCSEFGEQPDLEMGREMRQQSLWDLGFPPGSPSSSHTQP